MTHSIADYAAFLETIPDGAIVVDRDGRIVLGNRQVIALFGFEPEELRGASLDTLLPDGLRSPHRSHLHRFFAETHRRPMGSKLVLRGRRKDGSVFPIDVMLSTVTLDEAQFAVSIVRDVSQHEALEVALKQALERERGAARTDDLTGAANSRHFFELLGQEIDRFDRYPHPFTIAYLDLDNFKLVNDRCGHAVGDRVLCAVADAARQRLRKSDAVARLGGDEFALLVPETDAEAARCLLTTLRDSLLAAMRAGGWPVTFSIGALTCSAMPGSMQELVTRADNLMYEVKRAGKDAIRYASYEG